MQTPAQRLTALRQWMRDAGVHGFLVPRADEFQSEYVAAYADRLRWLTGFSGSAGFAVVGRQVATVFSDGRYASQLPAEIDTNIYTPHILTQAQPYGQAYARWIQDNLKAGEVFAVDPWLLTIEEWQDLQKLAQRMGITLKTLPENPVDHLWADQPSRPASSITALPEQYVGAATTKKIKVLQTGLQQAGCQALLLTRPDSICWLLNVRGSDVPYNQVVLSYALVLTDGSVHWFADKTRLTPEAEANLPASVHLHHPDTFSKALTQLNQKAVLLDPTSCPQAVLSFLPQATLKFAPDPCLLMKARKQAPEIEAVRAAMWHDGVALVRYLPWLQKVVQSTTITELDATKHLNDLRRESNTYIDNSFAPISASGPNGAVIHYDPTKGSNRPLSPQEIYLIDSGGHYVGATTDVTRTVSLAPQGTAIDPEIRDRYTRVLKGHIAASRAVFPVGTTGAHLDALARQYLWQVGCDYDHGTGHGVGAQLSVHEGPQRLSRSGSGSTLPLEAGMILSNEPGYYKPDSYGIRIENLLLVRPWTGNSPDNRPMLCFETLTLAPYDQALIDKSLLTPDEVKWINRYHQWVRGKLHDSVDAETQAWLQQATTAL